MNKIFFWILFAISIVFITSRLADVFLPFFIAFIFAYILQPAIISFKLRYNLNRTIVVYLIYIIFLSILTIILTILIPIIYQQITLLVSKIPAYKSYLQNEAVPFFIAKIQLLDPEIAARAKSAIQAFVNSLFSLMMNLLNNIWSYTLVTINIVVVTVLVPIILFYFLRDWPKIISNIESLLPLKEKGTVRKLVADMNELLSAYIRGQLNICLLLSFFYSLGLTIIGIDLSLLLGLLSGFLIIIPFIGTFISVSLALIIGYFTFGWKIQLLYISMLYIIGHVIEGYILTPKIIGDKIGLHPVWIMLAVLAFGSLFGLTGIFFAIPAAGIIKVLVSFFINLYKSSKFYLG